MNTILSGLAWLALAVLGVWLLILCWRALKAIRSSNAPPPKESALSSHSARPAPPSPHISSTPLPERKDVEFRPQGVDAGVAWGDLLCVDGIYLPCVGEDDYRISFDGRWITSSALRTSPARLLDRKSRRSWVLSHEELQRVNAEHWKLPRWNIDSPTSSGGEELSGVFSDAAFNDWIKETVALPEKALVAALDLWVPPDLLPEAASVQPPALPEHPRDAAVKLSLQRFLPQSLRQLRYPMRALLNPVWQLHFNAQPQPWLVDAAMQLVWRADGQALAFYGYPAGAGEDAQITLSVWSVAREWLEWKEHLPNDRKPWVVRADIPEPATNETERAGAPSLRWDGESLMQRMVLDTPQVERLHDGRTLLNTLTPVEGAASFTRDGRVLPRPQPVTKFFWERQIKDPNAWVAHSVLVAGEPVKWTLAEPAAGVLGATCSYQVQWGTLKLPGTWELEHAVVQARWIVLIPFGAVPRHGGVRFVQVWDGEQLQRVELPGAVMRVRPVPSGRGKPRAQVLLLMGCVEDKLIDPRAPSWRWLHQDPSPGPLGQIENSPLYEWRDIAQDVHGFWRMQPRWREVNQVQHPCADGDYVWRFAPGGDEIWWWGGLHAEADNEWRPELPRYDGVCVTSGGAVLCGVTPCALPQPEGQGWVVLEMRPDASGSNHWLLHWLRPDAREVRTLQLQAQLPLLLAWDGQGVHWRDSEPQSTQRSSSGKAGAVGGAPLVRQLVSRSDWDGASVEKLHEEAPEGLWMRKQDSRYLGAIRRRNDFPWMR